MPLEDYEQVIRDLVENQNLTCAEVRNVLRNNYGLTTGVSQSNIYRFCQEHDIHRYDYSRLTREGVDEVTSDAVYSAGPTYGRKMMTGLLRSRGLNLGERSVGRSLRSISGIYNDERRAGIERCTNPAAYYAEYAGHKLHLDQNEKMVMYGMTHIIAVDGFSSKILGYTTMPLKNNLKIYDNIYRKIVMEVGLFDQLRVDHGKEFYLCLYQQENLRNFRTNTNRPPYIQTMSRHNHRVERLWVEVNARVNYPLKWAIREMVENEEININHQTVKFCVSSLACKICMIALRVAVEAWNAHSIPKRGVPNVLFRDNCRTASLPDHMIPPADALALQYEQDGGGLTRSEPFGVDPLEGYVDLQNQREHLFSQAVPSLETVTSFLHNRHAEEFRHALRCYIDISFNLTPRN